MISLRTPQGADPYTPTAPSIPYTFTNLHIPIYALSVRYKLYRFVFFHVCCEFVCSNSRTRCDFTSGSYYNCAVQFMSVPKNLYEI